MPEILEPLDAGHSPVPADLLELYEILEWKQALESALPDFEHGITTGELGKRVHRATALPYVSRAEWNARSASTSTNITPREMACHYEGPHMGLFNHDTCATKIRGIQAYHMDHNGWADIAYSFVVCPHGVVFEGRGRGHRTAANGTNNGNQYAYAVCFLGGVDDLFTDEAKSGFWAAARVLGMDDAPWYPHRHYYNTACPGPAIMNWVSGGHQNGAGSAPVPTPQPTPQPAVPTPQGDFVDMVNWTIFTLRNGSTGWPVKNLQGLLCAAGRVVKIDGDFGDATEAALKDWQRASGVPGGADGVAGENTWRWLLGWH